MIVLRREMVKVAPKTAPIALSSHGSHHGAEEEEEEPAESEVGGRHQLCRILACGTFERAPPCRTNAALLSLLEGCAKRKGAESRAALLQLLKKQQREEAQRTAKLDTPTEKGRQRERKLEIEKMLRSGGTSQWRRPLPNPRPAPLHRLPLTPSLFCCSAISA